MKNILDLTITQLLELSLKNTLRDGVSSVSLSLIGNIALKLTVNHEIQNSGTSIPSGHLLDDKISVTKSF